MHVFIWKVLILLLTALVALRPSDDLWFLQTPIAMWVAIIMLCVTFVVDVTLFLITVVCLMFIIVRLNMVTITLNLPKHIESFVQKTCRPPAAMMVVYPKSENDLENLMPMGTEIVGGGGGYDYDTYSMDGDQSRYSDNGCNQSDGYVSYDEEEDDCGGSGGGSGGACCPKKTKNDDCCEDDCGNVASCVRDEEEDTCCEAYSPYNEEEGYKNDDELPTSPWTLSSLDASTFTKLESPMKTLNAFINMGGSSE
jgi:hypothetical protein